MDVLRWTRGGRELIPCPVCLPPSIQTAASKGNNVNGTSVQGQRANNSKQVRPRLDVVRRMEERMCRGGREVDVS